MSTLSRFVLDYSNLWVVGNSDGTISVVDGPDVADPAPRDETLDVTTWPEMARIGTNSASTHQELEVFGVVFGGQKLEELRKTVYDHQVTVNREGFMVQWLNSSTGGGDKGPKEGDVYRRLNDLFDWSKHGVEVAIPLETEWDRYQLNTENLMVEVSGLAQLPKVINELDRELRTLQEKEDAVKKENEELKKLIKEKDDQLAAKDEQIANLMTALGVGAST